MLKNKEYLNYSITSRLLALLMSTSSYLPSMEKNLILSYKYLILS